MIITEETIAYNEKKYIYINSVGLGHNYLVEILLKLYELLFYQMIDPFFLVYLISELHSLPL